MSTSTSAAQRAYDHVRGRLENGDLLPGTRLVTRNLATELGTSLNPVREALNRLASERLLQHVPGAGMFVHLPDEQEIRELYGLREAIESHAAAEAARCISPGELDILFEICAYWKGVARSMREDKLERLLPEMAEEWVASDLRFHRVLVDAARNRLLTRTISDLRVLATIFRQHRELSLAITLAVADQVYASHSELVESIRRGDSEAARRQMATMVQVGCRYVLDHMQGVNR